MTRLASKEIFSPSNKIHREVVRAKDLSAPLYVIRSCIDVQCFETSRFCSNILDCVLRLPGAWCLVSGAGACASFNPEREHRLLIECFLGLPSLSRYIY